MRVWKLVKMLMMMMKTISRLDAFLSGTFPMLMSTDAEFWIESDLELDEDLTLEGATITPTLPDEPLQESADDGLSLCFRAVFLTSLFVVLCFLGRYSTEVAELAFHFPHTFQLFLSGIVPNTSFEKRAVCVKCDAI